ncbi:MAG TPA: ABC transporter permease [Steroidobacteraceae bacterium]|nr:ABC transporter permease [Steroidobacteraceae bacterium]
MGIVKLILTALQSIRLNWLRALLTLLGIVIGVGSVIVMTALGRGAQQEVQKSVSAMGDNMIMVNSGARNFGGVNMGAGTSKPLDAEDYNFLRDNLKNMLYIAPVVRAPGQIVGGVGNWFSQSQGVGEQFAEIRSWTMASGAFFSSREVAARSPVVVLGATVAQQLFPDRDPIGEKIRVGRLSCTVVGVLEAKGSSPFGGDQDDVVYVPWTTAQARMTGNRDIMQILVSSPDEASMPDLQEEITTLLRRLHRLEGNAPDDFQMRTQTEIMNMRTEMTRTFTTLLASVAAISLLVGGIGIMNMMLVAVTERTREIGLRIALGARPKDIRAQFLAESVVICTIGGLLGTAMGIGLSMGISKLMGFPSSVDTNMMLIAVAFAAFVGVFFGLYPAVRASKLDPIEALRYG